jgi:peptidoglycan hydrolase-like protein with peptidoglycan-binding domain
MLRKRINLKTISFSVILLSCLVFSPFVSQATTQTGNGYTVNGQINPVGGVISGGNYSSYSGGNPVAGTITGNNGYTISGSGYNIAVEEEEDNSSGGGGGGGGKVKKCPVGTTGKYPNCVGTATGLPVVNPNQLSCQENLELGSPIRYGSVYINNPNDVKIVEKFLNTFEGENLAVNGIYELVDYIAIVKWQEKYTDEILKPWGITKGTGYVFKTTLAHMKRRQLELCAGMPAVPNAIMCTEELKIAKPVRYGFQYINNPVDVRIVERFLNTFEAANLPINGIYEKADYDAVIRWQEKYSDNVLKPWGITAGTGYVFTTSIEQMKRQQVALCASTILPVAVTPVIPGASTGAGSCPYFQGDYAVGSSGEQVVRIQRFLNSQVGAALPETGYFGTATQAAVSQFQKANTSEILGFWGLSLPTGNWYQKTREFANKLVGC